MKLWRVDTEKGASLVKGDDLPAALENAIAGRCLWGHVPKKGCKPGDILYLPTFDNVIRVEEVKSDKTTEGL